MAEYLQCGVCFEPYTASSRLPKFLQCGGGIQHTYCLQCLRRLTVGGMIKCPCCGDLTSVSGASADSLKNNIYLLPQIEAAAAAARSTNGLQMFCKTCTAVAGERCGEHQLLKMSELRDELRGMAQKAAGSMDTVKQRRAQVMALFREAHNVLASVAESVRRTVDDYDMDVQLDENIVSELERKREEAELLPTDQLVDSYRMIEQHVSDATVALHDTAAVEQCGALMDTAVNVTSEGDSLGMKFTVRDWLHSGDLMKALLAASVVVYTLDHVTSDDPDGDSDQVDACCKAAGGCPPVAAANVNMSVDTKPSKKESNGDVNKSLSKPAGKYLSSNGKAGEKSSNSAVSAKPVNKTSKATSDSKGVSVANGIATEKLNGSGKSSKSAAASDKPAQITNGSGNSSKSATASDKQAQTATAKVSSAKPAPVPAKPAPAANKLTVTAAATPKAAPSFSTMVKSAVPARGAAAVPEPAGRTAAVHRSLRCGHSLYCLRITDGSNTANVIIELRPDMAPVMCKNFKMLCEGGHFDNSKFHFAVHADYLLGGRVDDEEGFSPLAKPGEKFVMADQCPLQDECGAIRMKGMGSVSGPSGEKRGLIGSQFMIWVSDTREYRNYQYTLVFGFVRQGLDFIRSISRMERPVIWRNVRILSTKPWQQL